MDRFRLIDFDHGAVLCNQCFHAKNGDAISAVMFYRGVKLPEALELIGQYLGVAAASPNRRNQRPASKSRGGGNRATTATRATSPTAESPDEPQAAASAGNGDSANGESLPVDQDDVRHEVYKLVLSGLGLSDEHREALHQRGLTDAAIESGEYRSVVAASRTG